MISYLRLAPGAGAPNTVRNLQVACRIIAHHEERCAFMSAMSEQWKRDGDQWRRKVASYTKMIETMPELSENTLRNLWEELEKTSAQQAHDAAEAAILKYAKMVAAMEARTKDLTDMPEEQAHRTLTRLNEANNMLQSLYDWWQLQKSLWEGVVAWQMEQESHEHENKALINKLVKQRMRANKYQVEAERNQQLIDELWRIIFRYPQVRDDITKAILNSKP